MKLTRGNKFILAVLTVILLNSCQYRPEYEMVIGNWKYESVTENNVSKFQIGENDIMILTKDSFQYDIEAVGKHMKGSWSYSNHQLKFHYAEPDTTRFFEVNLLSEHQLILEENDLVFKFKRIKTD